VSIVRSLELFAGTGGLALGIRRAGFDHLALVEWDDHACATLMTNRAILGHSQLPILQTDVRRLDYREWEDRVDLLAGGPPCQPFSLGGRHRGHLDPRDMFPEMIRAVRETRPAAILIENVRGLTREAFATYFEYITLQLTYPEIAPRPDEPWDTHLARLEQHHTARRQAGWERGYPGELAYNLVYRVLNAADYGVPQNRHRVLVVGFRADLGIEWTFPAPTHSRDALLWDQWVTGEYWDRHGRVPTLPRPARLQRSRPETAPWVTVRDAVGDLPPVSADHPTSTVPDHAYIPGAREYPGHTGSHLDWPAKTLKAGVHGVPGGENAVVLDDGTRRYFSVRESARLQAFLDTYRFAGSWTETMRQLGNAVPVTLAERLALAIRDALVTTRRETPRFGAGIVRVG